MLCFPRDYIQQVEPIIVLLICRINNCARTVLLDVGLIRGCLRRSAAFAHGVTPGGGVGTR